MQPSSDAQKLVSTKGIAFARWGRSAFLALGILALSYVGYVLLIAQVYQTRQARLLDEALREKGVAVTEPARDVREGDSLGRIEIARVGLAAMVQEGVSEQTLRVAVGHVPGTSLPSQPGNVAFAGHRDTFFRGLRNVREDDEITLTTLSGSYRYRVKSMRVVRPEDTQVLDATNDDILTLVTCYPFSFVGSAPQRFVVRAHKVSW